MRLPAGQRPVDFMSAPTKVVLMFKATELGRVKTRLGRDIGDSAALRLYEWMGLRQLRVIPRDWDIEVRYTPDNAESLMRKWLGPVPDFKAQGEGDLGQRMFRAARECFNTSTTHKLIFLGADCLSIDEEALLEASSALDTSEVVLGPSTDGGYYLLGIKEPEASLFENIPWSSARVLSETMVRIQSLETSYQLLDERVDIDDWEALLLQRELLVCEDLEQFDFSQVDPD